MADAAQSWLARRARELRTGQTLFEQQLWQQLRAKRFAGFKFRRQTRLGPYIADFVCFRERCVIELDGRQHADQVPHDNARDAWLAQQGFRVLRFWNNQWITQPEAVLEAIWLALHAEGASHPSKKVQDTSHPSALVVKSARAEQGDRGACSSPLPLEEGGDGGEGDCSG